MPALHYLFAGKSPYFDIPRGWHQLTDHPLVLGLSVAICFSIAAFNLSGLGVTKAVSASARLVSSITRQWSFAYRARLANLQIDNRHLSDSVHLGRLAFTRVGASVLAIQLATDYRLCPPGVSHFRH